MAVSSYRARRSTSWSRTPTIKTYDTDTTALEDLSLGDGVRLDAVLTAQPTGLGMIADGRPLKQLGEPVYFEYLAPGIDRGSSLDPASFIAKVSEIVAGLHTDGTLAQTFPDLVRHRPDCGCRNLRRIGVREVTA